MQSAETEQRPWPSAHHSRGQATLVVLHGQRAGNPDVRAAIKEAREHGHEVLVRVTYEEGDVDRAVGEALHGGRKGGPRVTRVVAGGGDGTVNQVVAALVKTLKGSRQPAAGVKLGVLPLGTANDFASACGLPADPAEALKVALDPATARAVDVGLANGSKAFINVATTGFASEVTAQTDPTLKSTLGPVAYFATGVVKLSSMTQQDVIIRMPSSNGKVVEARGPLVFLAVGNARQTARLLQVCPDAVLDDGLLDVTYLLGAPSQQVAALLAQVFGVQEGAAAEGAPAKSAGAEESEGKGVVGAAAEKVLQEEGISPEGVAEELAGEGEKSGGLQMARVPWVEVEVAEGAEAGQLHLNLDGEPCHASRFRLEVLRKALHVHLPDTRLLTKHPDNAGRPVVGARSLRPGVLRDMVLGVRKLQAGSSSWFHKFPWKEAALRSVLALLVFMVGFLVGSSQQRC